MALEVNGIYTTMRFTRKLATTDVLTFAFPDGANVSFILAVGKVNGTGYMSKRAAGADMRFSLWTVPTTTTTTTPTTTTPAATTTVFLVPSRPANISGSLLAIWWDVAGDRITFVLLGPATSGWTSVGFTPAHIGDFVYGYALPSGTGAIGPSADAVQSLSNAAIQVSGGIMTMRFTRLLDTGDEAQDYAIVAGATVPVVYGFGAISSVAVLAIHADETRARTTAVLVPLPPGVTTTTGPTTPPTTTTTHVTVSADASTGVCAYTSDDGKFQIAYVFDETAGTVNFTMSTPSTGYIRVGAESTSLMLAVVCGCLGVSFLSC